MSNKLYVPRCKCTKCGADIVGEQDHACELCKQQSPQWMMNAAAQLEHSYFHSRDMSQSAMVAIIARNAAQAPDFERLAKERDAGAYALAAQNAELLKALRAVMPHLYWANIHGSRCDEAITQAEAAIKRAEGGA